MSGTKTNLAPATGQAVAGNKPTRLLSLDVYRGFIMLAMASAGLGMAQVAEHFPHSYWSAPGTTDWRWADTFWVALAHQFEHVPWTGGVFWDLIQPSFMFMVGVAMPFSYAGRRERGDSWGRLLGHAVGRSIVLVALSIFLMSQGSRQPNIIFTNVLAQIGLGYTFVFLLLGRGPVVQLAALAAVLVASWWAFYLHPVPESPSEIMAALAPYKLPAGYEPLTGLAAHWNIHVNFAAEVDNWLLAQFPPYAVKVSSGGYATLSFVPSMGTMILGLMAGELLRSGQTPVRKFWSLAAAGLVCLMLGFLAGSTVCPIVKRIWTPSWTLASGAATLWMLAALYAVIDLGGWRRWAFPFAVVGMNSIVMYVMSQTLKGWVSRNLVVFFGPSVFSGTYGPFVERASVLAVFWLICWWLYRQKIFVRI